MDADDTIIPKQAERKPDGGLADRGRQPIINHQEDAFRALDDVLLEVASADQSILELTCRKLCEENEKFRSPVIEKVCVVLKKLNRVPSVSLLDEALAIFGEDQSQPK